MELKAFEKSTNNNIASRFFAPRIRRRVKICDVVDRFLRKSFWFFQSIFSNSLVFPTSGRISSNAAAFIFLISLSTESSSSVNCPSLISNWLLIILMIGLCVFFGGFPSKFSKCCFHRCIRSSWLVAFSLAFAVLLFLLTSFIVCQAILDYLSSTESLILLIWFCM